MSYTLVAISCYIVMRGMQVLLEDYLRTPWCRILIKVITGIMLYAALASIIIWYKEINFLGFPPGK